MDSSIPPILRRDEANMRLDMEANLFVNALGANLYPKTVRHFTQTVVAKSMLTKREMWLFDVRTMNDRMECALAEQIIRETARHLGAFHQGLLEAAIDQFLSHTYHVYACCFSDPPNQGDCLSMWRGYGMNGDGVSLGISFERLRAEFRSFRLHNHPEETLFYNECDEVYEFFLAKEYLGAAVDSFEHGDVYEKEGALSILEHDSHFRYIDRELTFSVERPYLGRCMYNAERESWLWVCGILSILDKYHDRLPIPFQASLLAEYFAKAAALMKHWGFQEECEWRLVKVIPAASDNPLQLHTSKGPRGYHIVRLPEGVFCDVLVGPTANPEDACERLGGASFLQTQGVMMRQSAIPYRG